MFVVQNLFDETLIIEQISANQKSSNQFTDPISSSSSNDDETNNESSRFFVTLNKVRARMLETLSLAQATTDPRDVFFFISSCTSHSILTQPEFSSFRMGNRTLDHSLDCWSRRRSLDVNECASSTFNSSCAWPNCDRTCPNLKHPDANRSVVDFVEYFSFFGLVNYRQVADVLRTSEQAVRGMGYDKFMRLIMEKNKT